MRAINCPFTKIITSFSTYISCQLQSPVAERGP